MQHKSGSAFFWFGKQYSVFWCDKPLGSQLDEWICRRQGVVKDKHYKAFIHHAYVMITR